jgi:RsiW-degrading membrane proteinase PrsW (M82 family)
MDYTFLNAISSLENYSLIIIAILPSFAWLLIYLKKDSHPEPNSMVLKVFFTGTISGFLALLFQKTIIDYSRLIEISNLSRLLIINFFVVSLSEEVLKYLAVRIKVFKTQHLDEPLDIMLYMIISGLGFATLENIFKLSDVQVINQINAYLESIPGIIIAPIIIFISSTFLHALTSGIWGFFIAIGENNLKYKKIYFILGLISAVTLHALYNLSIYKNFILLTPVLILIMALFVFGFCVQRLQKIKSVCKIK